MGCDYDQRSSNEQELIAERSIITVALVALFPVSAVVAQTTGTPASPAAFAETAPADVFAG